MPIELAQNASGGEPSGTGQQDKGDNSQKTGNGSENAGNQPDKLRVGSGGSGADNGAGPGSDPLAGLSEEDRALFKQKGWESFSDSLKSYRDLEKQFSARGPNTQQEYRLGDYVFNKPQDAEKLGYNEAFADAFKQGAHKLKLSPEQASGVHDWFLEFAKQSITSQQQKFAEQTAELVNTAERQLKQSWGETNSPIFQRNFDLAQRAIRQLGLGDSLAEMGVIRAVNGKPTVANAKFFEAMAKVGSGMFAEDDLYGERNSGRNPFDPKEKGTAKEQGELIKSDPDRAEMLIRALPPEDQAMWAYFLRQQEEKRSKR